MKYPLDILKTSLKDVEEAKEICLKNNNHKEYEFIKKEKSIPLKTAIWLIELAIEAKLITELFNDRKGYWNKNYKNK